MNIYRLIKSLYRKDSRTKSLPLPVQLAIQKQQNDSERLISWTLLAVVLFFGALYIIAPKTFSETARFAPVPWALSAYLVFSLIRLGCSYRNYLPTWLLMFSALVDICLLMVLIWSFHIQYLQPPAFSLKAPTLLYLFIFVSLRTLRFEAKYVFTIGMFALLGWLTLFLMAIEESAPGTITRNYVLYLTSNHILIGGEVDKLISIFLVTLVLTLAVRRGQRLLTKAVTETIAAEELSKFFIPEIAKTIAKSGKNVRPGHGETGQVTILHCDIRGFTALSQKAKPSDVMILLTEYQARIIKIIHAHHGSVDKFLGDGILASFNAIQKSSHYAVDAIAAAKDIAASIDEWNLERVQEKRSPIHIGISMASGEVVLGIVGDETRMEYTVIGDPVNVAAKLDKHCKIEHCRILATRATIDIAKQQGLTFDESLEILPHRTVSGVLEPMDLAVICR